MPAEQRPSEAKWFQRAGSFFDTADEKICAAIRDQLETQQLLPAYGDLHRDTDFHEEHERLQASLPKTLSHNNPENNIAKQRDPYFGELMRIENAVRRAGRSMEGSQPTSVSDRAYKAALFPNASRWVGISPPTEEEYNEAARALLDEWAEAKGFKPAIDSLQWKKETFAQTCALIDLLFALGINQENAWELVERLNEVASQQDKLMEVFGSINPLCRALVKQVSIDLLESQHAPFLLGVLQGRADEMASARSRSSSGSSLAVLDLRLEEDSSGIATFQEEYLEMFNKQFPGFSQVQLDRVFIVTCQRSVGDSERDLAVMKAALEERVLDEAFLWIFYERCYLWLSDAERADLDCDVAEKMLQGADSLSGTAALEVLRRGLEAVPIGGEAFQKKYLEMFSQRFPGFSQAQLDQVFIGACDRSTGDPARDAAAMDAAWDSPVVDEAFFLAFYVYCYPQLPRPEKVVLNRDLLRKKA